MTFCTCEFVTQLHHGLPSVAVSPHLYWAENKKPGPFSWENWSTSLANVAAFKMHCIFNSSP